MNPPLIGCIADDYTGATDLAGLLRRSGMRVVQCFGVPSQSDLVDGFDAVVVALKTRSIPPVQAQEVSCDVARWLQSIGVTRFFFKYCSTFDSTSDGNIGPVAEALMESLEVEKTIFCPAFPENGRSVFNGYLFVGNQLLNECGMQNHPLNPMTDANLVRVLSAQAKQQVGLLDLNKLLCEDPQLQQHLDELPPLVVVDAVHDSHLEMLSQCVVDHRLVTGGSAIGGHIASALAKRGEFTPGSFSDDSFVRGPGAVLSGSCSRATQEQVQIYSANHPCLSLDIVAAVRDVEVAASFAKQWIDQHISSRPLITTTVDAESLREIQEEFGGERAAEVAEALLSDLGAYLVERHGVRQLVVAGGETSGAVTQKLGVQAIRIGPEIAPGVPWTESLGQAPIALALKSGNFGSPQFFAEAFDLLA